MILPLGTDRPLKRPTLVTHILLLLNVFAYCVSLALTGLEGTGMRWIIENLALERANPVWWHFASYAFLHAGLLHLLGNMLMLWVFGPSVEDRLGRAGFIAFYLFGGAIAGAAHLLWSPAPVIGASGAVAAVTGAYLVLFPRTEVRTFVFFILIGVFNIPALWFIAFAIARDVLGASIGGSGVSHAAHLGGYAFGVILSLLLLSTRILAREDYDLFFMLRQARRRREIREALAPVGVSGPSVDRGAAARAAEEQRAETPPEIASARAALSAALQNRAGPAIVPLYNALLGTLDAARATQPALSPTLAVLPRRAQLDLANRLLESGERAAAARAYRGFLDVYEKDPEAGVVRVMLALLMIRYLQQRDQARALLDEALRVLKDKDQEHAALARSLLDEIASPRTT